MNSFWLLYAAQKGRFCRLIGLFFVLSVGLAPVAHGGFCDDIFGGGSRTADIHRHRVLPGDAEPPDSYQTLKASAGKSTGELHDLPFSYWLDVQKYPSVESNAIRNSTLAWEAYQRCGTCKHMLPMHTRAFILPMMQQFGRLSLERHLQLDRKAFVTAGKFVLVKVDGVLAGVIKLIGSEGYRPEADGTFKNHDLIDIMSPMPSPTFLALRNIQNSKGELVMALGGVYYVTQDFFNTRILPVVNSHGPFLRDGYPDPRVFQQTFQFQVVNTDSLELSPQTFLLNKEGYDNNRMFLEEVFGVSAFIKQQGSIVFREAAWRRIQQELNLIRHDLESAMEADPQLDQLRKKMRLDYPPPSLDNGEAFRFVEYN